MNEAIKLAIEKGGYKDERSQCYRCGIRRSATEKLMIGCSTKKGLPYKSHLFRKPHNKPEVYLLDPLFWQALAKALGWPLALTVNCGLEQVEKVTYKNIELRTGIIWQDAAHTYFDLLLTGGDTETFWKELLNK